MWDDGGGYDFGGYADYGDYADQGYDYGSYDYGASSMDYSEPYYGEGDYGWNDATPQINYAQDPYEVDQGYQGLDDVSYRENITVVAGPDYPDVDPYEVDQGYGDADPNRLINVPRVDPYEVDQGYEGLDPAGRVPSTSVGKAPAPGRRGTAADIAPRTPENKPPPPPPSAPRPPQIRTYPIPGNTSRSPFTFTNPLGAVNQTVPIAGPRPTLANLFDGGRATMPVSAAPRAPVSNVARPQTIAPQSNMGLLLLAAAGAALILLSS